jgi:predicted DNA repair protein MutK
MATSGLLAVFDDITLILDDVAAMSKIAARKTVGIVGDDLAVNANVVVGIEPSRELPIVGKIALGSLGNKAVLIPLALALPAAAIHPMLMFGGAFLCYEAFHKISHKKDAHDEQHHQEMLAAIETSPEAFMKIENKKVWGAIGTDAILSAEVIAVALGAVAAAPLMTKALTLSVIGLGMTVGVYGLVAGIVKVDDIGLHLKQAQGDGSNARFRRRLGDLLVSAMPKFMKGLSFLGTAAMFAVGGGILVHGVPPVEHGLKAAIASLGTVPALGGALEMLAAVVFGILAGLLTTPLFQLLAKGLGKIKSSMTKKPAEPPEASEPRD